MIKDMIKKRFFRSKFLIIILFGLSFFFLSNTDVNATAISARIDANQTRTIDAHGVCRKVSNPAGHLSIFVPFKTAEEWTSFRLHRPAHIVLSNCCECTFGPCCDGCNFRSRNHRCDTYTIYDCPDRYRCGDNLYKKTRSRYCSGTSAGCTTAWSAWPRRWRVAEYCNSREKCETWSFDRWGNARRGGCRRHAACRRDGGGGGGGTTPIPPTPQCTPYGYVWRERTGQTNASVSYRCRPPCKVTTCLANCQVLSRDGRWEIVPGSWDVIISQGGTRCTKQCFGYAARVKAYIGVFCGHLR